VCLVDVIPFCAGTKDRASSFEAGGGGLTPTGPPFPSPRWLHWLLRGSHALWKNWNGHYWREMYLVGSDSPVPSQQGAASPVWGEWWQVSFWYTLNMDDYPCAGVLRSKGQEGRDAHQRTLRRAQDQGGLPRVSGSEQGADSTNNWNVAPGPSQEFLSQSSQHNLQEREISSVGVIVTISQHYNFVVNKKNCRKTLH